VILSWQTHAAVAVAKQHDGVLTIRNVGVASCRVVITRGYVSGEQGLDSRRNKIAGVVKLGYGGSLNCGVPDFNFVARCEFKGGDSDGERAGFGVHHCFNRRVKGCGWCLGA